MFNYFAVASLAATAFGCGCSDLEPLYKPNYADFDYRQNGENWGTVHNNKYALCSAGIEQSPIDLRSNAPKNDVISVS